MQEFGFVTLASFRLCECYLFVRSRTKTRCGKLAVGDLNRHDSDRTLLFFACSPPPPLAAHGDKQSMSHCSQLCKRRCGMTNCLCGWTESRRCKGELLHGARDCPPSCGEEPSLDAVLSVCLRCLVFASVFGTSRVTAPVCRVLVQY